MKFFISICICIYFILFTVNPFRERQNFHLRDNSIPRDVEIEKFSGSIAFAENIINTDGIALNVDNVTFTANNESKFITNEWSTSPYLAIDWRPDGQEKIITGDFNGDGNIDIAHSRSKWGDWRVSLSTGTGFITQNWSTSPFLAIDWLQDGHEKIISGDFNGDGKTDIARSRSKWGDWRVSLSTGTGFITQNWSTSPFLAIDWLQDGHEEFIIGDFNGDGKTDIAHSQSTWSDWRVSLSTGTGFISQNWSTSPFLAIDWLQDGHEKIITGDFNGDGKTDIARSRSKWGDWRVSLSTGNGFITQNWSTSPFSTIDWLPDGHEEVITGDFNGDGKTDVARSRSTWRDWRGATFKGNGFITQDWSTNPYLAIDWRPDGHEKILPEILMVMVNPMSPTREANGEIGGDHYQQALDL